MQNGLPLHPAIKIMNMKNLVSVVAFLCIAALAIAQNKTVYLNSKTATCNVRGIKKECLQYKENENDTAWNMYTGSIKGFTYNPGFFYTLQVRLLKTAMPQWQLVKLVSKTKSTVQQQPGDTLVMLSQPPAELVGQWNFTNLPAAAGVVFTIEFLTFDPAEMRVTGKASCNGFFGNYTADTTGGKKELHFEAIGHTMMACENLATENKILAAMEKVTAWSISGNKLYLKAGTVTLIELTRAISGKA